MGASPPPFSSLATVLNVARFWAAPPRTPRLHHLESLGKLPDLHTPALMGSPASAFPPHTSLAAPGPSPWWPGLCPRRQRAGSGADCCQTLFHPPASLCKACAGCPLCEIWCDSGLTHFLTPICSFRLPSAPVARTRALRQMDSTVKTQLSLISLLAAPPESENSF